MPRNRRIAEVFVRCGLVERSGQGANRMFEESIKESKRKPDFSGTDEYQVSLTLWGEVQDPRFVSFLAKVGEDTIRSFTTPDYLVLDLIHREQPLPPALRERLPALQDLGIVESQGRGKGVRYLLSRRFYSFIGKKGTYTRKRGLDKETNKALLLRHIEDNKREGSQRQELDQVLPSLSTSTVQRLLRELQAEGRVHYVGRAKAVRWYPGPAAGAVSSSNALAGSGPRGTRRLSSDTNRVTKLQ